MPPEHEIAVAHTRDELEAARRVCHAVFVEELGAHEYGEVDATHLIARVGGAIVGTVRVQDAPSGLAGEAYYDYTPLRERGLRFVEVARSSVLAGYRHPAVIADLWKAVVLYGAQRGRDHFVTIVHVGYTDSLADAAIVHARLAQQQLLHPTIRLAARGRAASPEPPRFPLPAATALPAAFRLFHRFGLRTCGEPVFMSEIGRVGLAMLAGPDTFPPTAKSFFAAPAPWIRID
jgi:hypothetical protein